MFLAVTNAIGMWSSIGNMARTYAPIFSVVPRWNLVPQLVAFVIFLMVRGVAHIRGETIPIIDLSMAIRGPALPAANSTVRQAVALQQGIPSEKAKDIVKFLKDAKLKRVQASIQGEQVRVSSKSRDELHER